MVRKYRNISFATVENFADVLRDGQTVTVRGHETKELRNWVTAIARPLERCIFIPGRRHNIFAQIAETIWVIAGKHDVPWLTRYLPRAPDYSNDGGKTWHGAYGPRLRAWAGTIDQIDQWRQLLLRDPASRRVTGVLFDPSRDFLQDSNDIPCNNWLSWLLRDDQLHLSVAIRSNDGMWGFSGVNAFEWSVLQEMMAFWINAKIGETTFFATSYHVYARHYEKAGGIVGRFYGLSPYEFGISSPRFQTDWNHFSEALENWFQLENQISSNPDAPIGDGLAMKDPFLGTTIRLLRLFWGAKVWTVEKLHTELASLEENDFAAAAYEHYGRDYPEVLSEIRQPQIAQFFDAFRNARANPLSDLKLAIKKLHARKNLSYAGAWKRRGECISVLPNIARKVDRLKAFADQGIELRGEPACDTVIDLLVYAIKYQLLLAESPHASALPLGQNPSTPLSDHDKNFDYLLDNVDFSVAETGDLRGQIDAIAITFDELCQGANITAPIADKQERAQHLSKSTARLLSTITKLDGHSIASFIRQENTSLNFSIV